MVDGDYQMSALSLQDRQNDDEQRVNDEAIARQRAWEVQQRKQPQQNQAQQQPQAQQPQDHPDIAKQRAAFEAAKKQLRAAERANQEAQAEAQPVMGTGGYNFATIPGYAKATTQNCKYATRADKLRLKRDMEVQYPQYSFDDDAIAKREKLRKELDARERDVEQKHEAAMRALEKKREEKLFEMAIERTTLDTVAQADANMLGVIRVTNCFLKVLDGDALREEKKRRSAAKVHKANAEYVEQLRRQDARREMEVRTRGHRAQRFQYARGACSDPEDF